MNDFLIEALNIKKIYQICEQEIVALKGVSFHIKIGEFVAITGQSGSGKSTLLHILGCLDISTDGIYKFKNKVINNIPDKELAKIRNKKVGFVFQSFNLLPRENSLHNVELPFLYNNISETQARKMAISSLEKVNMMHRINHLPNELSGGEKQRVAIARALVTNPELILADEPTGNLDSKVSKEIISLFEKLHKDGKTIIIVTHEPSIAKKTERIIRLKDGKII